MKKKHRLVDEFVGEELSPGLSAQAYIVKKAESKASWGIICRELGPWFLFVSVPMPYRMVKAVYLSHECGIQAISSIHHPMLYKAIVSFLICVVKWQQTRFKRIATK
jgi:hypothetical protein